MSPNGQAPSRKFVPPDNLYTVILAIACGLVLATVVVVAYMCYVQYGTLYKIP